MLSNIFWFLAISTFILYIYKIFLMNTGSFNQKMYQFIKSTSFSRYKYIKRKFTFENVK